MYIASSVDTGTTFTSLPLDSPLHFFFATLILHSNLSKNEDGLVAFSHIQSVYKAESHPRVTSGQISADESRAEMVRSFEGISDPVSEESFKRVMQEVSSMIPYTDDMFRSIMKSLWPAEISKKGNNFCEDDNSYLDNVEMVQTLSFSP